MRRCLILLIAGAVVIASTIIYALVAGNFTAEAVTMFPLPWFQLSMVDLYLGFLLFWRLVCARHWWSFLFKHLHGNGNMV